MIQDRDHEMLFWKSHGKVFNVKTVRFQQNTEFFKNQYSARPVYFQFLEVGQTFVFVILGWLLS